MSFFPIPRFLGWANVLVLLIATLGLYEGSFLLLRSVVFIVSIVFIMVTHIGRKRIWVCFFGLIALLFNPILPPHLSFQVWRVIDAMAALGYAFFLWNYYNSYGKGYQFEDYVASLFPSYEWVIADKTRDYSKKFGRVVESDSNPDFTFRHIRTNKTVAIECKYRSYFYNGGFELSYRQLTNYINFGTKNKIPVHMVLGVGGSPKKPEKLFLVPMNNTNGTRPGFFAQRDLEKSQRNPAGAFTINDRNELV